MLACHEGGLSSNLRGRIFFLYVVALPENGKNFDLVSSWYKESDIKRGAANFDGAGGGCRGGHAAPCFAS